MKEHVPTHPQLDEVRPGLEGVLAATTTKSRVDGKAGRLVLAGYELEDVAGNASFEEIVHLLWTGRREAGPGTLDFRRELDALAPLTPETLAVVRAGVARGAAPIEVLRMGVSTLPSDGAPEEVARRVLAAVPGIVAATARLQAGEEVVRSEASGIAARFLEEQRGEPASEGEVQALETYLNTVVDHGFNASTFTCRVIISTQSDLVSAVTGAIGALKGPLHGGAPGPVLDTLLEIGTPDRAEEVLRRKLDAGERIMGFGHRVYEVRDPRAEVLRAAARRLLDPDSELLALADAVEATALDVLRKAKPGRRIETNVEFYTALLLHALGIEAELFTSVFAMGRTGGWCAHAFEQLEEGRLIRPRALYVGDEGLRWSAEPLS